MAAEDAGQTVAGSGSAGHAAPERCPAPPSSARTLATMALLGTGATNRQIARRLFISERTVGVHVSRVLHKLQVTNRAQAAAVAAKVAR
jgi:DNA-binding NarL/FixJ family response regulator